ncbi:MAG: DUF1028 domain-containing protein [Candidatus Methanofastidiosia archaeon]
MTFSTVAYEGETGDFGVAVQSKFISVGALVPWAKAKVGAVATQALANLSYGPKGLELLEKGHSAERVLKKLLEGDEMREHRQVGIVDSEGNAASFTGKECLDFAGHIIGENFCVQGNILVSKETLNSMAKNFENTKGDLPEKLLASLEAGQMAGGDRRGQQSAALIVVREKGGYGGHTDRYIDVRVDDHEKPIEELKRIFKIYDMTLLTREDESNLLKIEGNLAREIQEILRNQRFYMGEITETYNSKMKKALDEWLSINNFENKMRENGYIWKSVLEYMREHK